METAAPSCPVTPGCESGIALSARVLYIEFSMLLSVSNMAMCRHNVWMRGLLLGRTGS